MKNILSEIRSYLKEHGNEKIRKSSERFFKEKINVYGFKTPVVISLAKKYMKILKGRSKNEVFELCEELWSSGMMEESFIACHFSYEMRKQYSKEDIAVFERWVDKYVSNWASCDTLCNHTVGTFIEMYPEFIPQLKKWAVSDNRWMRRASAVTLIIPARHGLFLTEIFELADIMLHDKDDLVQKGYGWMLKAASQAHENEVFKFVLERKALMPRTALRYSIEKMSADHKSEVMRK